MSELPIKRSESFGQLIGALALAQQNFGPLVKTHINTYTGKKYADLADVIEATQPSLSKNGISVVQVPIRRDDAQEAGVLTILAHSSGEYLSVELILPATMKAKDGVTKFDQQSIGSAITYARRYTWQALVGVAAEEDDDGNDATDRSDPRPDAPKPKPIKTPPAVNQTKASTGGERPPESKVPRANLNNAPEPPSPQQPPATAGDPEFDKVMPVQAQFALPSDPKTEVSGPENTSNTVESAVSDRIPTKTEFDAYVKRVQELRIRLENHNLKPSGNLSVGDKLKLALLKSSGAKDATKVTVTQWERFLDSVEKTTPAEAIALIEGGKK